MFIRARSVMTSSGTVRACSGSPRSTLSRLNATRLPSPTALTTISGWPDPSCTMSPAAKKFVSPSRPNRSILIVPRSFLNSVGQPGQRRMLSDGDDHVVDREALGRRLAIDRDRRGVDGAAEARRMQLQRLDLAVAEHGGHRPPVHQLDAFLEHVVQIFGHARHLARRCLRR